jgi:hypothetical protein
VGPLKGWTEVIPVDNWQLRQRFIEAMARMSDDRFRDVFVLHLDSNSHPSIRHAAIRGLARLGRPEDADLLAKALTDSDQAMRQVAAESLGRIGKPKHLGVLYERLEVKAEPNQEVRVEAWKSFANILAASDVKEQLVWLRQIDPGTGSDWAQRFVEVAEIVAKNLAERPKQLAAIRSDCAKALLQLGKRQEAAEQMQRAYEAVAAVKGSQANELAGEMVELWLAAGQFDLAIKAVNKVLANSSAARREKVLAALHDHLSGLLTQDNCGEALRLSDSLDNELRKEGLDDSWLGKFSSAKDRAAELRQAGTAELVRQAIVDLRGEQAGEAEARIKAIGKAAVPQLKIELSGVVQANPLDRELETVLLRLLRDLAPHWQGYDPAASPAVKIEKIDFLRADQD